MRAVLRATLDNESKGGQPGFQGDAVAGSWREGRPSLGDALATDDLAAAQSVGADGQRPCARGEIPSSHRRFQKGGASGTRAYCLRGTSRLGGKVALAPSLRLVEDPAKTAASTRTYPLAVSAYQNPHLLIYAVLLFEGSL